MVTETIPPLLVDLEQRTIVISGTELLVVVADTGPARRRGLMGVADLGPLDGMVFVFDEDASAGFWMKDTLIPLEIAFFSSSGDLVDRMSMVPCEADPCAVYTPGSTYRYAVEVAEGGLPASGQGDRLLLDG